MRTDDTTLDYGFTANRPRLLRRLSAYLIGSLMRELHAVERLDGFKTRHRSVATPRKSN